MPLPNFICVGAQKAGTSTLYDVLKQSPDVFFPKKKELHYYEKPELYKKGTGFYQSFFEEDYNNQPLIGEITPEYLFYSYVPQRIIDTLGKIKIIILLRNPAMRSYSQFNFHKMFQVEELNADFMEVIGQEKIVKSAREYNTWCEPTYYLSKSMYYEQVKRYIDLFGRDQVFVGIFEELFNKESLNLQPIFDFLEIPPFEYSMIHSNPSVLNKSNRSFNLLSAAKRKVDQFIPKAITQKLAGSIKKQITKAPEKLTREDCIHLNQTYFIEDIHKTEELLNVDLSIWYR